MTSFTISGVEHLVRILNKYPALSGLSSLTSIYEIGNKAKIAVFKTKCGCSANKIYNENKIVFEQALNNMSNGVDKLMFKNTLKVDQICFYTSLTTGKRELKCV